MNSNNKQSEMGGNIVDTPPEKVRCEGKSQGWEKAAGDEKTTQHNSYHRKEQKDVQDEVQTRLMKELLEKAPSYRDDPIPLAQNMKEKGQDSRCSEPFMNGDTSKGGLHKDEERDEKKQIALRFITFSCALE
jgi:hypothetical protein